MSIQDELRKDIGNLFSAKMDRAVLTELVLGVITRHPEAVLSLLGTVRKGWATDVSRGYADCVTFIDPPMTPESKPVFVVSLADTPKGEST